MPFRNQAPPAANGSCTDREDNDGDGLMDLDDPACNGPLGTCDDGIDNDGNGLIDLADPNCRVGDDLGGGNAVPFSDALSGLTQAFYDIREDHLDSSREPVFRYALSSAPAGTNTGTVTFGEVCILTTGTLVTTGSYTDAAQNWIRDEWEGRTVTFTTGPAAGESREILRNGTSSFSVSPCVGAGIGDDYVINRVGGVGETPGDDFIDFNHDGGSIMHEFGHNLGLEHGGDEDRNCKPNYVSVMNYDHQIGIRGAANPLNRAGWFNRPLSGPRLLDYSPPRFWSSPCDWVVGPRRGHAPLPTERVPTGGFPVGSLNEGSLDEAAILDGTALAADHENNFIFVNAQGDKVQWPLDGYRTCVDKVPYDAVDDRLQDTDGVGDTEFGVGTDWDGDGDWPEAGILSVNTDTTGPNGRPSDCANSLLETLTGYDDWTHINLGRGLTSGDPSPSQPVSPSEGDDPTLDELLQHEVELNTTDLQVALDDSEDPVEPYEEYGYVVRLRNAGPNPAAQVQLLVTLPPGVALVDVVERGSSPPAPATCAEEPAGTITCHLGPVPFGMGRAVELRVVADAGALGSVAVQAAVHNLSGDDTDAGNDTALQSTEIADMTPPVLILPADVVVECARTGGAEIVLPAASAEDAVDPNPTVACDHSSGFFPLGTTVVTCTASDASGNTMEGDFTVTVADTVAPAIACPPASTAECSAPGGVAVDDPQLQAFLLGISYNDVCDPSPVVVTDAPPFLGLDGHTVTFTVTDGSGNAASCAQTVEVVDTTPPTLGLSLAPAVLWPPNRRLVDVAATVTVEDVCDPGAGFVLSSVTSSEPEDSGRGSKAGPDIVGAEVGTPDVALQLRAERSGGSAGRTYTVIYESEDASKNSSTSTGSVSVPHDQKQTP